ncbi:hypothetical protein TNCV_1903231 [Trichonephila clavipes]|nr:hypothetical protein TNCV_1903231 [Trichonephila clavipes]
MASLCSRIANPPSKPFREEKQDSSKTATIFSVEIMENPEPLSGSQSRFNILKDNEERRKQHSRSFMARREPHVLTLRQS